MKILVLGNGFDLAHYLPTKYSQFLEFVRMLKAKDEELFPDDSFHRQLLDLISRLGCGTDHTAKEAQAITANENKLLDHFLKVYNERCKQGKTGWIDFEAEIADIIKTFDEAIEFSKSAVERGKTQYRHPKAMLEKLAPFIYARSNIEYEIVEDHTYSPDFLKEKADLRLQELNELTRLFEIYLTEFVEQYPTEYRIPEIYQLRHSIDAVLSFNYTDTYRRLYCDAENVDCCFIH